MSECVTNAIPGAVNDYSKRVKFKKKQSQFPPVTIETIVIPLISVA